MSMKTLDDQREVFTCDQCGKEAKPGVGLPDGWMQFAVGAKLAAKDRMIHLCSDDCRRAYDEKARA